MLDFTREDTVDGLTKKIFLHFYLIEINDIFIYSHLIEITHVIDRYRFAQRCIQLSYTYHFGRPSQIVLEHSRNSKQQKDHLAGTHLLKNHY